MNYKNYSFQRITDHSAPSDNPRLYHNYGDFVSGSYESYESEGTEESSEYTNYYQQRYSEQLEYLGYTEYDVEIGQNLKTLSVSVVFSRGKCDLKCRCFTEDLTDERNEDAFSEIVALLGKVTTAVSKELEILIEQHLNNQGFNDICFSQGTEKMITVFAKKGDIKYSVTFFAEYTSTTIPANSGSLQAENTRINFDAMEGHEFEYFCADVLRKYGFENVTVTQGSGDQGIDVIAYRDGIKHGIQCKCYTSAIGNKAIQEALAGKIFYQCHVGIVLTNNYFTRSAVELAEHSGIVLWDRYKLLQMINNGKVFIKEGDMGVPE